MGKETKNVPATELDTSTLDESLTTSIAALRKSLGLEEDAKSEPTAKPDLKKSKSAEMDGKAESTEEEEEEEEEEDDEEGYEETKKSIEAQLDADPEAEAAMDVEPFLRTLAKGVDNRLNAIEIMVKSRLDTLENLTKAQSHVLLTQAELQKSIKETTDQIGKSPVTSMSVRNKVGDRFAKSKDSGGDLDVAKVDTFSWLQKGLIDINMATVIDNRITKGTLLKSNDSTDDLVKSILSKEAK